MDGVEYEVYRKPADGGKGGCCGAGCGVSFALLFDAAVITTSLSDDSPAEEGAGGCCDKGDDGVVVSREGNGADIFPLEIGPNKDGGGTVICECG